MKNLKVNSSSSGGNDSVLAVAKGWYSSDSKSCISDAANTVKESDVDQESLMSEQGIYYPEGTYSGYYYPGYDMLVGEWGEQGYFVQHDGLEMQYPVIQGDNGSLYFMPGFQPAFSPYGPCIPCAVVSVDGQYITQYPYLSSPAIPQPLTSPGGLPYSLPCGPEAVPVWPSDPSIYVNPTHGNCFVEASTFTGSKPNVPSAPSHAPSPPTKLITPSKPCNPLERKCSSAASAALNGPLCSETNRSSVTPINKGVAALSNGHCPIAKTPPCQNQGKGSFLCSEGPLDAKANGKRGGGDEKIKASVNANGVCDLSLLNEQNRGPRKFCSKNSWASVADLGGSNGNISNNTAQKNGNNNSANAVIRRDQYNLPDFPTKYEHALFFVIKSYSEDDVHKSIKYGVWSSTPNGNKKLDSAYQDAHERTRATGCRCPVFLFFSVNASGQFCGVAEMIGRVDFNKNMDFWHQDKWSGFFPVKWHIIKDVPNPQLRHIILENNENKPVTNSRDTQEVKFPQGTEMLNIFKNYSARTSIFDDFGYYEGRQKVMQDERIMHFAAHLDNLQEKSDEGVLVAKMGDLSCASGH